MVDNRGIDIEVGRENREHRALWKAIEDLRAERRAAATTVSSGDLTIENGGSVKVNDGGAVLVDGGLLESRFLTLTTRIIPAGIRTESFDGFDWSVFFGELGSEGGIDSSRRIRLKTPTNEVRIDHATTAAAANAVLDSTTGRLSRSTSSLRYKQDVEAHDCDPALVLQLQPRSWRDRAEVTGDEDTEQRYVGFIAEELHDLGLTEFVVYDVDGLPEAISYDRLSVALLALAKAHHTRLEALEQTVAEHTALLATLTEGTT